PQNPLYLLQGIWIDENDIYEIAAAYGENYKILNAFKRTAREMLDIIHGNSDYTSYGDIENAIYDKDVSPYVIGFILGLEWMPEFIMTTNENNPDKVEYRGEYLYTENATPFEAFLCNVGNELIEYQTEHYQTQTPVAFLNWQTTDTLTHPNEPFPEEDMVSLNTNSIRSTGKYYPGLFAAVDIYPYYPEFMNYEKSYIDYIDPSGKTNPYRAYLKDLVKEYSIPVIVAEFGVPTSRGKAHISRMGYNQGGITEKEQGEINLAMMQDIAKEGYAGGVLFSWQDEWFKQTWNTVKFYAQNPYTRTQNPQSAEQHYGIIAFDILSGDKRFIPDGNAGEWEGIEGVRQGNIEWKAALKENALYLYINWRDASFSPDTDTLAVAIGTTRRGSKKSVSYGLTFSGRADFLVLLNGKDNTHVLTDAYYDVFYYQYSILRKVFPTNKENEKQNSGIFNPIRQFLSNEIVLPVDKTTIPPQYYESGLLRFGNANPASEDYDSLADFYYTQDFAEIKIPWVLLNVMNFPEKRRLADFHAQKAILTEGLDFVSIGVAEKESGETHIQMHDMELPYYGEVVFTERLKQSYDILTRGLPEIMKSE
ncbi:MAG TPA: family 2 glycosyl transferase, partial [Clostridia bacterium]|nr:family 2 glycosyl transferase [Clostridia bacterium]